jgi:murein DD-endopeptidase MepM/ murein hydrolase activator NlpD
VTDWKLVRGLTRAHLASAKPRVGVIILAMSAAAGSSTVPAPALHLPSISLSDSPAWQWPLRPIPNRVVRDFDPPAQPWLPGNRGLDLAGHAGQPVHAAGGGVVSFAGTIAHVGVVSVTSGALRTTYQPVTARVHRGQPVAVGTVLGTLTRTGSHCLPSVCLHWGLLRGDAYLDPLALLNLEQVRLLPLDP